VAHGFGDLKLAEQLLESVRRVLISATVDTDLGKGPRIIVSRSIPSMRLLGPTL
jgi:hypothetical protein